MKFYTLEEISKELHISPGTARNRLTLCKDMPPSVRIGRRRLFPASEFEKWVVLMIEPVKDEKIGKESKCETRRGRPNKTDRARKTS